MNKYANRKRNNQLNRQDILEELQVGKRVSTIGMAMAALIAACSTAAAGDGGEMLDCWTASASGWASAAVDTTTPVPSGAGPEVTNLGFNFSSTADNEVQCAWIVPADFDTSAGGGISVQVGGWLTSTDNCGSSCSVDGVMEWEVAVRKFTTGDSLWGNWTTTGLSQNVSRTPACNGVDAYCADRYMLISPSVGPASASSGDILVFRIKRRASLSTDTVNAVFHLARARYNYEAVAD